jgi:hypothetical protein
VNRPTQIPWSERVEYGPGGAHQAWAARPIRRSC